MHNRPRHEGIRYIKEEENDVFFNNKYFISRSIVVPRSRFCFFLIPSSPLREAAVDTHQNGLNRT